MSRNLTKLDDCFKAIKELQDWRVYMDTKNLDFHQRQIKNAHPSIDDYDYVVRKELKQGIVNKEVNITGQGSVTTIGGNRYVRTFGFAVNQNLIVDTDALPPLIIPFAQTQLEKIYFKAKTAPTGSDAIADVLESGVSILNGSKLTVPDGDSSVQTVSSFVTDTFTGGQVLTFNVTQVGSTVPGKTLVVTLRFKILEI